MKAILVIDIPDGIFVEDCVINYEVQESVMQKIVSAGVERLRPLPKRKIVLEHRIGGYIVNGIEMTQAHGYNECLDEILGETE